LAMNLPPSFIYGNGNLTPLFKFLPFYNTNIFESTII
jgi:hypothetical protein